MLSLLRLYVDAPLRDGATLPLSQAQTHYLRQVMRRKQGDHIELFNGRDGGWQGTLSVFTKREAVVMLNHQLRPPAQDFPLTLCFAAIKRAGMEMIAQKATELGVTRLQPMVTARTTAKTLNPERLTAIIIEAAEQCERVSVPDLAEPLKFDRLVEELEGPIIFADEAGNDKCKPWGGQVGQALPFIDCVKNRTDCAQGVSVLIGPEGGFAPEERDKLRSMAQVIPVRLGPRILRAETAAIASLTIVQALLGDWR